MAKQEVKFVTIPMDLLNRMLNVLGSRAYWIEVNSLMHELELSSKVTSEEIEIPDKPEGEGVQEETPSEAPQDEEKEVKE